MFKHGQNTIEFGDTTQKNIAPIVGIDEQWLSQEQLEIGHAVRPRDGRDSGDDDQFVARDLAEADAIVDQPQCRCGEFLVSRNLHNRLVVPKIAKNSDGFHREEKGRVVLGWKFYPRGSRRIFVAISGMGCQFDQFAVNGFNRVVDTEPRATFDDASKVRESHAILTVPETSIRFGRSVL